MEIVNHAEWVRQRKELLAKEKEFTRLRDDLARRIQAMPWEPVEKEYTFKGPEGAITLSGLFGDSSQLIVYHFMLGPDWEEGCKSCSLLIDNITPSAVHLAARDTAFVVVSRAPLDKITPFRTRMGWDVKWVSAAEGEFQTDYHVSVVEEGAFEYNYKASEAPVGAELPGLSVFAKDDQGNVFHTYSSYSRGLEQFMTIYRLLDVVPKGRDEDDCSYGMEWVRHHDQYYCRATHTSSRSDWRCRCR